MRRAVTYATAEGTATTGTDYQSVPATPLTFTPETDTQAANVSILGDTETELRKTFLVNLSNPTKVTIARGQAVGTILDDEAMKYYPVTACRVAGHPSAGGPVRGSDPPGR